MTNAGEAVNMYTRQFTALQDAGSQCDYLITLRFQKSSAGPIKTDSNRISDYRIAIWINAEGMKNCLHFTSESNSLLVCGILAIYEDLCDGESQEGISSDPPDFLGFIFGEVIYLEIKQNGLLEYYKILCTFQKINHNDEGE